MDDDPVEQLMNIADYKDGCEWDQGACKWVIVSFLLFIEVLASSMFVFSSQTRTSRSQSIFFGTLSLCMPIAQISLDMSMGLIFMTHVVDS